jgi:hypothetical protein
MVARTDRVGHAAAAAGRGRTAALVAALLGWLFDGF